MFLYKNLIISFFLIFINNYFAEDNHKYKAGRDYTVLDNSTSKNPAVIEHIKHNCGVKEILEFFNYSCPACHSFEPYINGYINILDPSEVKFNRLSVVFHAPWEMAAKYHITAKKLNTPDDLHKFTFNHIYNDASFTGFEKTYIKNLLTKYNQDHKHKVNIKEFLEYIDLPTNNRDIKNNMRLFQAYKLSATPTLVINNKYVVSIEKAKSFNNMIKITEYLINNNPNIPCPAKTDHKKLNSDIPQ